MDADIKNEFGPVRADIQGSMVTTLRQEIREEGVATRRHFDVVGESLRDDFESSPKGLSHWTLKWKRCEPPELRTSD